MNFNILICTIDDGIKGLDLVVEPQNDQLEYVISHQLTDRSHTMIPKSLIQRKDIKITQIYGRGLSRNRNNAILWSSGDIALIADDDVQYIPEAFNTISSLFSNNYELDVACFKIKTLDNEPEYKLYPAKEYWLNAGILHYVSSIEIAFRIRSIKEKKIFFDERFGLGSKRIPAGEESVFIYDCIKAGLNVKYFPIYIVKHPFKPETLCLNRFNSKQNKIAGAVNARIYGWKSVFIDAYITTINIFALIANKRNPLRFLYERLNSAFYILITDRKNMESS